MLFGLLLQPFHMFENHFQVTGGSHVSGSGQLGPSRRHSWLKAEPGVVSDVSRSPPSNMLNGYILFVAKAVVQEDSQLHKHRLSPLLASRLATGLSP